MNLTWTISLASIVISIVIFLVSFTVLESKPEGYMPVDSEEEPSSYLRQKLERLGRLTFWYGLTMIALNITRFYIARDWLDVVLALEFVIVVAAFGKYNQNATTGGHVSAFLMGLFMLLSQLEDFRVLVTKQHSEVVYTESLDQGDILLITKTTLQAIYLLYLGFFTTKEPDAPSMESREVGASIFSLMTIGWLSELIYLGNRKTLQKSDIWYIHYMDKTKRIVKEWHLLKKGHLLYDMIRLNRGFFLFQYFFAFMVSFLSFGGSFFMYQIITALQRGERRMDVVGYVFGLLICSILQSLGESNTMYTGAKASTRIRSVLINDIYEKTLKRIIGKEGLGNSVSLMSVDADQMRRLCIQGFMIFLRLPLTIIIGTVALFNVLGESALIGVALILLFIPISGWLGKRTMKYKKMILANMDKRVSMMSEILQGMRIVKYFAWEEHFTSRIDTIRKSELGAIVKWWINRLMYKVIGSASGILISFTTLATYSLVFGKTLDAATAFTSLSLLLQIADMLGQVPFRFVMIFNALTSLERIHEFLEGEELQKLSEPQNEAKVVDKIAFDNASFEYHQTTGSFMLKDLNMEFELGKIHLITGSTGSGKSSIFMALLGEMKLLNGTYSFPPNRPDERLPNGLRKTVAYAAQTPWIMNATVRENILFGEEYDEERYVAVLRACALVPDLSILEGGDLTEIGERGVNLSGGQKQRISLARVCYSKASIVLLDHPFSAVDAPTARLLFHRVLMQWLRGRTILIASHNYSLVAPIADKIYKINDGYIEETSLDVEIVSESAAESQLTDEEVNFQPADLSQATRLIQKEQKATGRLDWSVYQLYFNGCGGISYFIFFIGSFLVVSGSKLMFSWWLTVWTDHNLDSDPKLLIAKVISTSNTVLEYFNRQQESVAYFVFIYSLIGLLVIVTSTLQYLIFITGSYRASNSIHKQLLYRILHAPLRFFDTTPVGRILNRFSNDLESIDTWVMDSVQSFLASTIQAVTVVCVIIYIAPLFAVIFPFLTVLYLYLAKTYLTTSRELKRFESINRSPVFGLFSETLSGITTIRAYGQEQRFKELNMNLVDENVKPRMLWILSNRWLSFRTDVMSAFVVFFACFVVSWGDFTPGLAALTISYSLQMSTAVLDAIRDQADLELILNSVERAQEYIKISQEPPYYIEETKPSQEWPEKGRIVVKDLGVKYADDLPFVLRTVSFSVLPGEKLAIVGRTGAGKSTLSLAFFRIVPLLEGSIVIDGVDISTLGLHDLRSRLSVITQDPVLFSGSIRSNMDPLNEKSDDLIWDALNRVKFVESFQKSGDSTINLDYEVNEGGSNLSQGQRQLLCLARSLLLGNKIIFLDEATASVDNDTDAKIQTTIRSDFAERTIICIAHRLRTMIDYDKVLVLDKGQVVEFGTPLELIERSEHGTFRSMCEDTGEFEELCNLAKQASMKYR